MDIQQFTLLAIGVGLGFFVHTIAGFAAALVAYPIILQVIDIQEAVGFLSIFFFCFGATQTVANWHNIEKKTQSNYTLDASKLCLEAQRYRDRFQLHPSPNPRYCILRTMFCVPCKKSASVCNPKASLTSLEM
jgi:hypothetical protein